jgi:hypothetical protein
MKEPQRLRDGAGPARELLLGAPLRVPVAARRRALAFTAAAVNATAAGTALAASGMSLGKSIALCVSLGVAGGSLASLGVSSLLTHEDGARASSSAIVAVAPLVEPKRKAPPASLAVEAPVDAPPPAVEAEPALPDSPLPAPARASRPAAARATLFDEQRVIEGARASLARGDASGALQQLDHYQRRFPDGQFHPEALALRVEALRSRGDVERAQKLADDFARRYPQHPLSSRVGTGSR